MNIENSKTNEPHKFILNLFQRLDLLSLNKNVPLHNLYLFITYGKIQDNSTETINSE